MWRKYKYINGALKSKLSSKSRIPPMPGKRRPESFSPASRLKRDSIKSPTTAADAQNHPQNDGVPRRHPRQMRARPTRQTRTLAAVETTTAPAKPSHVLPGLMRGIILCLPMSDPTA